MRRRDNALSVHAARLGNLAPERIQAALDRFDLGALRATRTIETGNFGQNLGLETSNGEYILRGNPFFDWQFPKERAAARILHERTDVPVPWPYLVERSSELFGWPFAIMPRLPGRDLWNVPESDQTALAGNMGELLVRFQRATFDEAMAFDLTADAFVPEPRGETSMLTRNIERNLELSIAASDRTSNADAEWVRSLLGDAASATRSWGQSCLVHGDFTINNVVAVASPSGWEITGVFDLMTARVGSFEADLCRQFALHHERTPAAGIAFLEAYFRRRPPRDGYRDRMPMLLLDERLTLWEWMQRTRPDWWISDIGLRDWAEPVLDALLAYR